MKKTIKESIIQLRQMKKKQDSNIQGDKNDKIQQINNISHKNIKHQDKRNVLKQNRDNIFKGYSFCFPIVDIQISPKQIQLLTNSIKIEGGKVIQFNGKAIKDKVDFLLVNPALKIQFVLEKIKGKLSFKQILDYRYITQSLRDGYEKQYDKYSMFVNVQNFEPKKKRKQSQSSDQTIKLQKQSQKQAQNKRKEIYQTSKEQIQLKKQIIQIKKQKAQQQIVNKMDIQEIMLVNNSKGMNNFSMNNFIADQLTKLMKIYATQRDIGRKFAYSKAAAVIRSLDRQIESQKDIENIKGIGDKISKKIKQLLTTGKMEKLQNLQKSQKTIICGEFCKIWGIGPSKAHDLYDMGIRSIEQLRKRTDVLTKNQKIGLKYHEQFQKKIPREKVTKIFNYIKTIFSTMVSTIDDYNIEVCGSYRRQKPFCGDIDIIICRKDGTYEKSLLSDLVKQLQKYKFLTQHLTQPKIPQIRSSISYMGVCKFQDENHHRIDIKYYPMEEFAFAILYFTGSGMFNRMLRLHCMKLGLNFSDHGAHPKMQKGVIWKNPIPICYTQKDIFDFLGFEYKSPKQRDM